MSMLDAAYGYVDRCGAWPLIPVSAKNKLPMIKTGRDHAEGSTTSLETIRDWHRRGILNAIGMPTGITTGTVVIDVDKKHDGETLLAILEDMLGPLPRFKVVRTQSGGLHIYCAHPGAGIRVKSTNGENGELGKLLGGRNGIDVKSDGGIVVLPPSCGYTWIVDDDEPLPPLPLMWLAAIQGPPPPKPSARPPATSVLLDDDTSTFGSGGRNEGLFQLGCRLRRAGCSDGEIEYALERANALRCSPPLREREVRNIAAKAAREKR